MKQAKQRRWWAQRAGKESYVVKYAGGALINQRQRLYFSQTGVQN